MVLCLCFPWLLGIESGPQTYYTVKLGLELSATAYPLPTIPFQFIGCVPVRFVFVLFSQDKVFLCRPCCPGAQFVD